MTPTTVSEVLTAAADVLSKQKSLAKRMYRDQSDNFCSTGAIHYVLGSPVGLAVEVPEDGRELSQKTTEMLYDRLGMPLDVWNDSAGTTVEDAVELFRTVAVEQSDTKLSYEVALQKVIDQINAKSVEINTLSKELDGLYVQRDTLRDVIKATMKAQEVLDSLNEAE